MKNMKFCLAALAVAISASVSGCAVYQDKRLIDRFTSETLDSTTGQVKQKVNRVSRDQKWASQDVNLPFITGKSRPLSRDASLPAALRGTVNITTIFPNNGQADLVTIAERIQDASGILVEVTPDALLPLENFGPKLTGNSSGGNLGGTMAPQTASTSNFLIEDPLPGVQPPLPGGVASAAGPASGRSGLLRIAPGVSGEQKLPRLLDAISTRLGVYWRWEEDTSPVKIVIFRTETRSFEVRGAETNSDTTISMGLTGSMGETGNGSIESKSKTTIESPKAKGSQTEEIVDRVKQYLTRSGSVVGGTAGNIVVTDTKSALDQISRYIESENTVRKRTVDFVLEEITVENNKSNQAGATWNLFFNSGGKSNQIDMTGLNSLLEEGAAASLGATVGSGPWAGSSVAVQALSTLGKIVNQRTDSFGTNNRQLAIWSRPERRKYIDKLDQTPSFSDNSRPTVSVTQSVEQWGRTVELIPNAYADGDVSMVFKYDDMPEPFFRKQVFPDGSYVQSPESSGGTILARHALVHSGQPYIIGAQMATLKSSNAKRVDENAPMALGGSDIADSTQRVTVLVLTAMVRE
ncbi:hypothetical protein M0K88_004700 [Escherichia coli]|nr:hypothetical protein [Escherichia coli]